MPNLPQDGLVPAEEIKEFLLTKLINAENASLAHYDFDRRFRRVKTEQLQEIVQKAVV